jgi:hypothetical protein
MREEIQRLGPLFRISTDQKARNTRVTALDRVSRHSVGWVWNEGYIGLAHNSRTRMDFGNFRLQLARTTLTRGLKHHEPLMGSPAWKENECSKQAEILSACCMIYGLFRLLVLCTYRTPPVATTQAKGASHPANAPRYSSILFYIEIG